MIFMGLILKIPLGFACWILWWAWNSVPDDVEAPEGGGGNDRVSHKRRPKGPRNPRRGPHAPDALPVPCSESGSIRVVRRRPSPGRTLTPAGGSRDHD